MQPKSRHLLFGAFGQLRAYPAITGSVLAGLAANAALVFVVFSVLSGLRQYVSEGVVGRLLGAYTFQIRRTSPYLPDDSASTGARPKWGTPITNGEAQAVIDALPPGSRWAILIPVVGIPVRAPDGGETPLNLQVIAGSFFAIHGMQADVGRLLTPHELESGNAVAVLGSRSAELLFPRGNAVGQSVRIQGERYIVVGVARAQGRMLGASLDETVYASLRSAARRASSHRGTVSIVMVQSDSRLAMVGAIDAARGALRSRRRLRPSQIDDFSVITGESITALWDGIESRLLFAALVLPLITTVVSGLVLANLMMIVAVDRIAEIGLRRAVGASARDVGVQFLAEAMCIAIVGTGAGQLIGLFASWVLPTLTSVPTRDSASPFLATLALAVVLGLVVGWLPARYASRLTPIDALGRER